MIGIVKALALLAPFAGAFGLSTMEASWRIDSADEWEHSRQYSEGFEFDGDAAHAEEDTALHVSKIRKFAPRVSAENLVVEQNPSWRNWRPIPPVGPENLLDAPVFLVRGPGDYWLFGRYGEAEKLIGFQAGAARLEGFEAPLKTPPWDKQFDSPGGLNPSLGGYHAWQSRDMIHWVHHGAVSEEFSRWVTTAEFADGKTYIYYDFPNDQDPHLYIDENLTDGVPGVNHGLVFKDPSDGSDCAVIRDLRGRFHLIYEDWSPINASLHLWDSPLAGHAVSENGIDGFTIRGHVIDERSMPTGEFGEYEHPHWADEDPDNFPDRPMATGLRSALADGTIFSGTFIQQAEATTK